MASSIQVFPLFTFMKGNRAREHLFGLKGSQEAVSEVGEMEQVPAWGSHRGEWSAFLRTLRLLPTDFSSRDGPVALAWTWEV